MTDQNAPTPDPVPEAAAESPFAAPSDTPSQAPSQAPTEAAPEAAPEAVATAQQQPVPPPGAEYAAPTQWPSAAPAAVPPAVAYPAPAVYAQPAAPTSSNAVIALILAVVSWVLCPIIAAVVALVFASTADKEIAASGGRVQGSGLVTAARIVAWVNIGLTAAGLLIAVFVGLLLVVAGGMNGTWG